MTVADVGEFGLIARVTAQLPPGRCTVIGPGDDAAVVRCADGRVVATTDLLVEGRHFRTDWSAAYDIGRKAAAQNLADVAAMGAVGTALLVGLGCPADTELNWTDRLVQGLRDESAQVGAAIVGGDVVAASRVILAVTALGDLEHRSPVTRSGSRPGNVVAVYGRLGWAAAGLALLRRGLRSPESVVAAHRRPEPPYSEGPRAAAAGATSMIDVSDGLVQDVGHLASASEVAIDLRRSALDLPEVLVDTGAILEADPYSWVLGGGEDHALVATFPDAAPDGWRVIGAVHAGRGVTVDGIAYRDGHDHFG